MTNPELRRLRLLLVAGVVLLAALTPSLAEDDTLRVEDVVRRFVQGESVEALIQQIRTAPVDFVLDDEMLEELKIAGLPESLIGAMVARQKESEPEEAPVEVEDVTDGESNIVFVINPPKKEGKPHPDGGKIHLWDFIDSVDAERLDLRADQTHFDDLAVYIQCRTAEHVPDRWRSVSPLGRDFRGSRRHRMLLFLAGADASDTKGIGKLADAMQDRGRTQKLALELPATLELHLDEVDDHQLTVGIAARIGERYLRLTSEDLVDVVIEAGGSVEYGLRIENQSGGAVVEGLSVRQVRLREP